MGKVATVLIYCDEIDTIANDVEFGRKLANAILAQRGPRNKISIGGVGVTVMTADARDTAFIRVHGNSADRLPYDEEAALEKTLSRFRKSKRQSKDEKRAARR